jgi:Protein of unknown function (DUF551)
MSEWRPIETAPRDGLALYWIRPRSTHDPHFVDTNGNPITGRSPPRAAILPHRGWSSLEIATHWMPLPEPPIPLR